MYQNRQNRLVIVIFFLVVASALLWLIMRSKAGSNPTPPTTASKASAGGKIEVSYEALDKAWKEAKKMEKMPTSAAKGPVPPTNMPSANMPISNQPSSPVNVPPMMQKMAMAQTKEMGSKDAKVRIDAFLPMESCQGATIVALEKLAKDYKDKIYLRTYPLFGPAAGQVGVHCATIFINGKNYAKVDGKEVVFGSEATHNVNLLEKAVKQAIAEAYAVALPQEGKK